ncbi:MAG: Ig-like domain-containing protein, partial [Pseudomonadota bacterium]|nr:Ig-like domain-containing protein [Pseudomonadota bacterium]
MSSSQANDNKTIWAGTFTPDNDTEDDNNTLSLGTNYTDLAGTNGPDNQTANYEVDTLAPTVRSVEITDADGRQTYNGYGFLNEDDNVSVTATFSEAVTVAGGTPTLTLTVGSTDQTATYTSGSGSDDLVFGYTIQDGDTDSNGISIGADVLDNRSSTIRDAAGNIATDFTHDAADNNTDYIVDTTPPTISSVTIDNVTGLQNNFLNEDDEVTMKVTFNEPQYSAVIVNNPNAATLTIKIGDDNRTATYDSGSGTTVSSGDNAFLKFKYEIQDTGTQGENDDDGISIPASALNSGSIEIRDAAGNISDNLSHSAVSDNSSVKVDTIRPSVDNFTMSDIEIIVNDNSTVTLVFSEEVILFNSDNDITVPNVTYGSNPVSGELSTMTTSDNITWIGYFTPTLNIEDDTNTLTLIDESYTDLAGNLGHDNQTANYEVDTAPPTATFAISDRFLRRDRTTGVADNATITITFSEPVIRFDNSDITIPNLNQAPLHDNSTVSGTLSPMTSSDNITWTGIFTPTFPETEDWTNT